MPEGGICHKKVQLQPLFFSDNTSEQNTAKALCFRCPVVEECLVHGMHERYGIFGGLLPSERAQLLKLRRKAQ